MRMIQESSLYQITFFKNESLSVNCYLVEEDDELTLIDTGISESYRGIMEAAAKINKPITRIALTHAHHDHIGGLDSIKQAFPNVQFYISSRESRLLSGDLTLDIDEPQTPIRGTIPKHVKTKADMLIQEGDRIKSLLVLATPGHTPGSISFFDTRNKALIAGDSFQTEGGIAVAGQLRPSFPYPALGTWNKQVALASAQKLYEYQPSLLATGHGPMMREPCNSMERAIDEAEQNINGIKRV
ncbi:MBL fold metallo-hydrolase [Bacillus oleivorans]|uniref:MBL fold metallo-hydrolase n=1 Tax=Bacillus oleivorans TaxID=1448271 RepID=UPI000BE33FBA|nr:MBL fold metallo-hydrolase [Bacillus oleivorans]